MRIFKTGAKKITLQGEDFTADSNGIIDVPDDKIDSSVWAQGFVSAKGREAELAKEEQANAVAEPVNPVIAPPVVKKSAEPETTAADTPSLSTKK